MKQKCTRNENFSTETLAILDKWIEDNIEFPYPNIEDLQQLSVKTGLNTKQIRIWCTNTRKVRIQS